MSISPVISRANKRGSFVKIARGKANVQWSKIEPTYDVHFISEYFRQMMLCIFKYINVIDAKIELILNLFSFSVSPVSYAALQPISWYDNGSHDRRTRHR